MKITLDAFPGHCLKLSPFETEHTSLPILVPSGLGLERCGVFVQLATDCSADEVTAVLVKPLFNKHVDAPEVYWCKVDGYLFHLSHGRCPQSVRDSKWMFYSL